MNIHEYKIVYDPKRSAYRYVIFIKNPVLIFFSIWEELARYASLEDAKDRVRSLRKEEAVFNDRVQGGWE